jgi:predicted nucleic acid-binding protein
MTAVVVDTDVVSFIFKNHPIGRLYEEDLAGCTLLVSFMTVAELDRGPFNPGGGRRAANGCDCISNDSCCCPTAAYSVRFGRIECADAWIAATARRHDVPLVTHNRDHYLGVPDLKLTSHGE